MKRYLLLALVGGLVLALWGCAMDSGKDGIDDGGMTDSTIIHDSVVVAAPSTCTLEYGFNASEGRARVGSSIVSIPAKSEIWFCSPIDVLPGSSVSLDPETRPLVSWKSPSGSTQIGILEEMPMIVTVR